MNRLVAWTYSLSFPLGVGALLGLRLVYGYHWPLPHYFGAVIAGTSLLMLIGNLLLPKFDHNLPRTHRQEVYTEAWVILVGLWMFRRPLADFGLVLLIAVAAVLWPLSHLELHKHVGAPGKERAHEAL